jgi:molybdopterin converting factor small subunit
MPLQAQARGFLFIGKGMKVTVQFHGILSDWMGGARAELSLSDRSTFGDLLMEIKKRFSMTMPSQLRNKDQQAFNRALWAVRGKDRLSELGAELKDGDEVRFFLSLAGG